MRGDFEERITRWMSRGRLMAPARVRRIMTLDSGGRFLLGETSRFLSTSCYLAYLTWFLSFCEGTETRLRLFQIIQWDACVAQTLSLSLLINMCLTCMSR